MALISTRNAVVAAAIMLMAAAVGTAAAEVSCGDSVRALIPCGSFLVGADAAAAPSESCCRGALALRGMASTTAARRELCKCLMQSGPSFGVLPDRARQLPARCNLGVAIPVGPETDCDKIP
ncbi:non-specific lipid-transfer protein 3 [Brachypodium distachyon]|uniref:Bifunctional inhibitor/plant lipid transfer protein/seed storage helical domain-containing protein n=1 Tax=Brachypodium distachyon TaxID=15368 RepID=I1GLT6_BRADI|nr:non-specific lipid-transfer protein 3 [Brachypodium distachyon]KQK12546.1 hypothetical protein BRADI_1g04430v3 [Brachypodium distachyon]|eukprot:XP_010227949.1 non-specific lipid-transfer protein 3 [Brachypodium distachyon]